MLPPQSAIRPAIALIADALSGLPMIVTCERPSPRARLSPDPRSTSTDMSSSAAVFWIAASSFFQSRGTVTSTPRISRRRSRICSMSMTSTPAWARVAKTEEVTPGRSLPVSVISRVSGLAGFCAFIAPRG